MASKSKVKSIRSLKEILEQLGHSAFYITMRFFGQTGGYLLLYPVIFSYVLFSRKIKENTQPYLSKRFVEHVPLQLFFHRFHNILNFGRVLVDRGWLGTDKNADIKGEVIGREKLLKLVNSGKGIILITAHVGNWQSALAKLDFLPVKVHALMQYDQQAAAKHFFDLGKKKRTFEIINADTPFGGMIEATAALQRGEVVTIMGDRFVKGTSSTVNFLGAPAQLPNGAYTLAACVKSPVVIFLAAKTSRKTFQLKVWDVFYPQFQTRDKRQETLDDCCQKFADCLDKYIKVFPYQWYNFFDFWKQETQAKPIREQIKRKNDRSQTSA